MAACLSVAQTSPFSRWIAHTGIGRKVPVPAIALPESWTVDIGLTRVDHVRLMKDCTNQKAWAWRWHVAAPACALVL